MNFPIKNSEMEALAALARAPATQKAVAEAHTREVADRTARVARIAALDKQAETDWPADQSAIAKAIKKVRDIERMLLAANDELRAVNSDAFNKSHAYTRSRQEEEAALIERAELPTINAWKNELLNELTALGRPSVIVTSRTVERSLVTRKEIRSGFSNVESVRARMKAVRASYETADELKLVADQRKLPAIIDSLRASWPLVDQNHQPKVTPQ